jgi:pimeloyl-ACP methyl ester carboxylesterase
MLVTILLLVVLTALPLLAATAAAYAVGRRAHRGDAGTQPLHPVGRVWAFLHEWLAEVALIAAWPFRLRQRPVASPAHGVAVFVPELRCSSAGFWYLRRRLRAGGWSSVAGVERPASAAEVVAALDARLAELPRETELVFVGHGIGGLLACEYVAARPELRVRHVVTLGTPHQGSRALPYRLLGATTPAPEAAGTRIDVIAIYSDFDAWLIPVDDAYCPRAFNIAVRGIGHCAMLQSRRVADLIAENLAAPVPKS